MNRDSRLVTTVLLSITVPLFVFGLLFIGLGLFTLGAGQYGEDSVDHGRFAVLIAVECLLAVAIGIAFNIWRRHENE